MELFGKTGGLLAAARSAVLAAVAPPGCASCDRTLSGPRVFCAACAATLVRAPVGAPLAFGEYGGALAIAINRFKHGDRPDLARSLGDLLRHLARERRGAGARLEADCVLPVPLHPRRLASRRYNPASMLARELANELEIPIYFSALERVLPTRAQQGLSGAERRLNLTGAFASGPAQDIAGARVILVDDVCTTGATLAACSGPLLAAGAVSVQAVVLAQRRLIT